VALQAGKPSGSTGRANESAPACASSALWTVSLARRPCGRHLQRFGLDAHVAAYRELFERITQQHFQEFPELAEEARLVGIDGSALLSHYSSFERVNPDTGETLPPTLEGGGYMPRTEDNAGKDGHGFNLVAAVTQSGLPLTARLTPIAEPEAKTAQAMLGDEWKRVIDPYLHDDQVRIMACDAAYSGSKMRAAIHRAGYIPNCHPVSHGSRERSLAHGERRNQKKLAIRNRPDWHLNGHMELACKCGHGKTLRRATRKPNGEAVARLVGECASCGTVTLTAGEWRQYQSDKPAVAKALPDEQDRADWRIGNPLTFNDPLSAKYVSTRFSQQEGFHGTLVTRFGQLKEKQWYRRRAEAERDLLQVFCLMHALAMTNAEALEAQPSKRTRLLAPAAQAGAARHRHRRPSSLAPPNAASASRRAPLTIQSPAGLWTAAAQTYAPRTPATPFPDFPYAFRAFSAVSLARRGLVGPLNPQLLLEIGCLLVLELRPGAAEPPVKRGRISLA
jgi:hypothetical protein